MTQNMAAAQPQMDPAILALMREHKEQLLMFADRCQTLAQQKVQLETALGQTAAQLDAAKKEIADLTPKQPKEACAKSGSK